MIRSVIENLLLFLTPAFLYFAYILITRGAQEGSTGTKTTNPDAHLLDDAPYVWLFLAGTAIVLLTLVVFGSNSGGQPGQHYVPPTMKDGRIEPGRIEPGRSE